MGLYIDRWGLTKRLVLCVYIVCKNSTDVNVSVNATELTECVVLRGGLSETCTKKIRKQQKQKFPEKLDSMSRFLPPPPCVLLISCKIRDSVFCIYYWMKLFSKSTVSSRSGVAACKYVYHKFKQ